MRRFAVLLTSVLLVSSIVGCGGGGIQEGLPSEPVTTSQTPEFRDMMEKAAQKMKMKGKGKLPAKASSGSTKDGS